MISCAQVSAPPQTNDVDFLLHSFFQSSEIPTPVSVWSPEATATAARAVTSKQKLQEKVLRNPLEEKSHTHT